MIDSFHENVKWRIRQWEDPLDWQRGSPPEKVNWFEDNCLLNTGINLLWTLIAGSVGTKWDNANARLGVGTSAAATSATQGSLVSGVYTYKNMDSGYPTGGTSQICTWRSTFGTAEANHAWNEFTVNDGTSGNISLNRAVSAQGTKASGQIWELTLQITFS